MDRPSQLRLAAKIASMTPRVADFFTPEDPKGVDRTPEQFPEAGKAYEKGNLEWDAKKILKDDFSGREEGTSFIRSNYSLQNIIDCWYTMDTSIVPYPVRSEYGVSVTVPDTMENMQGFERKHHHSYASVLVVFPDMDFHLYYGEDDEKPVYEQSHHEGKRGPHIGEVMAKNYVWLGNLKRYGALVTNAQFKARLREHGYSGSLWSSSAD